MGVPEDLGFEGEGLVLGQLGRAGCPLSILSHGGTCFLDSDIRLAL
jgi:hypothetical protein